MKNLSGFNSLFVVGWSAIQEKNSYQINHFRSVCVNFKVFVTTQTVFFQDQKKAFPNEFLLLHGNFLMRLFQVRLSFSKAKKPAAIFVAPAGRFAITYLLLAKIYGIKIIAIEWGDLYEIDERDFITRLFYLKIMRFADIVWFKEPYMKELLLKNNVSSVFYLPNSVPLNMNSQLSKGIKDFDFIWANRNITSRYPELLIKSLVDLSLYRRISCVFIGLFSSEQEIENWLLDINYTRFDLEKIGITFKPYGDAKEFFLRSRFFVLLADHVFGNNSLLEAMSIGLVPLVNGSEGVQELVVPQMSGNVCELDVESIKSNIAQMLDLTDEERQSLALNAHAIVKAHFGVQKWENQASLMLKDLHNET